MSSDDDAILAEAERAGAVPIRRAARLALDTTTSIDVVRDFLGQPFASGADILVLLQPTSPFRAPADIDACVARIDLHGSAATVCQLDHPIEWSFGMRPDGTIDVPSSGIPARRQDAGERVRLAGSVYASGVGRLLAGQPLVSASTFGILVPRHRALDIDEQIDLDIARALAGTTYDPLSPAGESRT